MAQIDNMKMKKILLILFITINSLAQKSAGIISYKVKLIENKENSSKKGDSFLSGLSNSFNELNYTLKFNKGVAFFTLDEVMEIDDHKEIKRAAIFAGNDLYYTNLKEHIFLKQTEFAGNTYLVTLPNIPLNWIITQEGKSILNFKTYKATAVKIIDNKYHPEVNVTAWFTPEIPVSIGPKNYFGLPGLILELQVDDMLFYARELNFKKSVPISKPRRGIKITEDKLEKLAEEKAFKLFKLKIEN